MTLTQTSTSQCFDGQQTRYQHQSEVLRCDMMFSVFLPPAAESKACPTLYWLSGLTCTDENFVTKAGAQKYASEHGVIIVAPDTSPRGEGVPDDPDGAYDFGLGAGFYVNATQQPWSTHYNMYDYITKELPTLINTTFPVDTSRVGIFGHSMGGHGALTIALKNPDMYKSVSAFAPIVAPIRCPWGQKALGHYLGDNKATWATYDATELISRGENKIPLFVDQGLADQFLDEQLKPELLETACQTAHHPLTLRCHEGYDHSYYFIASFMEDHIRYHVDQLSQ